MNNLLWAAAARVPIGVTEPNVDLVSGGGYVSYWALIAVAWHFLLYRHRRRDAAE